MKFVLIFVNISGYLFCRAHLAVNELTVSKLSTFELNTVSISTASILLQRYNVEVDAEVPAIEVDVGKPSVHAAEMRMLNGQNKE